MASGSRTQEWAVGKRVGPFTVEKPRPHRPEVVVVFDRATDLVVCADVLPEGEPVEAVAERIASLLPAPTRSRRARLVVEDEVFAAALRAKVYLGVEVVVGPTPEVDHLLAAMAADVGGKPVWGFAPDVPEADLAAFYAIAERFWAAKPWNLVDSGQALAFDLPGLGWEGGCALLAGGPDAPAHPGLMMTESLEDAIAFFDELPDPARAPISPPPPILCVYFDTQKRLPGGRQHVAFARRHGFSGGPRRPVPYVVRVTDGGVPAQAGRSDARAAAAMMAAILGLLEQEGEDFSNAATRPLTLEMRVTLAQSFRQSVRLVAPPPGELPWRWGEEAISDGLARRRALAVCGAFEEARRTAGSTAEEAHRDAEAAHEMLRFHAEESGRLAPWTPEALSAFLLDFYPGHGEVQPPHLADHPDRVERFLTWLETAGHVSTGAHAAASRRLAQIREAFGERASDRRRFGPAKTVLAEALAEGVDLGDSGAVDAFMNRFNERVQRDPSLLPLPGDRHKAWTWDGQSPPPSPQAACPCGSGKRYRRCCMPR